MVCCHDAGAFPEDLLYFLNHPLHTFFIFPLDPGHHLQRRRDHRVKAYCAFAAYTHFPGIARIIDQDAGSGNLLLQGDYFESEEGKYPPVVRLGGQLGIDAEIIVVACARLRRVSRDGLTT
jgi:hypothetical protein